MIYYAYNPNNYNNATVNNNRVKGKGLPTSKEQQDGQYKRENAAFVVLARNSDLNGLRSSMQMVEDRFNRKYNYPWVFLNDVPFDEKFKEWTTGLASGKTYYGELTHDMWGYPDWIDQDKAKQAREKMAADKVIYGGSESYRHMCRFQSGWFFRHPLMDQFDYYWRVEPDIKFTCDVDYDPFRLMRERDLKYGFTISLHEYETTIPTLWQTTKNFMKEYPQHIIPANSSDSLMKWISDDGGETYNLCHFWSNFEIASLAFLRSQAYLDYFNYLDKAGGFFYERWGDAPVHSIAAALMLKKSEVHYFYDMGYFHNPFFNCPSEPSWLPAEKCSCDPTESMEKHWWSCTQKFLDIAGKKTSDFVITTRN
ncbi:nucleotide-diphospho-sugar transferase [Mycotypha africana]|uniref:nucleotide-diphospho-sugar transferase n=1 Tax=Mycotypha africana TaxID=64632 RepID=UPI0022FFE619|nr:nucleotide-diphospho-sugar transferase [Mycotypha africana]KAI8988039.1 nucleotide-diphospho-sugar transferase [Mycotypha africana]